MPRHRGFKSAIRNVARFSFQSADRCKVKDFLRAECVSIDVRLLKCTRICRNPRDNGSRIWPTLLLWPAYVRNYVNYNVIRARARPPRPAAHAGSELEGCAMGCLLLLLLHALAVRSVGAVPTMRQLQQAAPDKCDKDASFQGARWPSTCFLCVPSVG